MEKIELIKVKLIDAGYSGLYYDDGCACEVDDLAPCGECEQYPGEDYINDCQPGYKFEDDKNIGFWVIKSTNIAPTDDELERARKEWL